MYIHPPGFVDAYFFYRSAMVQSWNKFCYQGGMLGPVSNFPELYQRLLLGKNAKVQTGKYYPTWPGIWMMGISSRYFLGIYEPHWPFSYDACEPDLFNPATNASVRVTTIRLRTQPESRPWCA
ncbi:Beta-glucan synthesis-associated, SKN1 [Phytophthora cactorum]|nr:Beta-glucan synthesis-associated, SKN1 [Phytophthora cactorum]